MSHNITATDSLFTVRKPAWHGLGTVLADYPTRAEAQALAHPWEPETETLYRRDVKVAADGTISDSFVPVETHHSISRSDTHAPIGVTTTTTSVVSNTELYDVAEALQGTSSDVKFETGGSLKGGSKVWLLLALNDPIELARDRGTATLMYYGLQNSHDGSGSFRGQATATRIVCDNTAQMADLQATADGTEFVFRHTVNIKDRIEEAKLALAGWRHSVSQWKLQMEHLLTIPVTWDQRKQFRDILIPEAAPGVLQSERVKTNILNARRSFVEIIESPTCADINRTAYGLLQAAVEYSQHYRATRAATEVGRIENRFQRAYLDKSVFTTSALDILEVIGAS